MITNITQTKFYNHPTPDSRGNCQQAAMASLLGLQLDDVPDFFADGEHQFWPSYWRYVKSLGLVIVSLPIDRCVEVYHLAYGDSSRGCRHAVVYFDGKLAWDPHPSREGLVKVDNYEMLVPRSPALYLAAKRST